MPEETQESRQLPLPLYLTLTNFARWGVSKGREQCGLVLLKDGEYGLLEINNSSDQIDSFRMSTDDLLAAYQIHGESIIGCWHTHVRDTLPSELDKQYAPPEMRYWIATPKSVVEYDMQQPVLTIVSSWHASNG